MLASGCTLYPPIVPIRICAGWLMVCVKDRYLKYASSGNNYVFRCTNCDDHNSTQFSVSPHHFDLYSFEMYYCIEHKKQLYKFLFGCLYQLTENANNGHVKYLAKFLFASLCHHHEYLEENLHTQSLLIYSTFFCNVPDHIRECVKVADPWDKTRETPLFNGVPTYVLLMAEMIYLNI